MMGLEVSRSRKRGDRGTLNKESQTNTSSELLDLLECTVNKKDTVSSGISARLAELVQGVLRDGLDEKKKNQLDKLSEKVARPDKCQAVDVPNINPEIWEIIGAEHRNNNLKVQKLLKTVEVWVCTSVP